MIDSSSPANQQSNVNLLRQKNEFLKLLKEHRYRSGVWRRFGFQNQDMTTDFRATGLFGVIQVMHFASHYPKVSLHSRLNALGALKGTIY